MAFHKPNRTSAGLREALRRLGAPRRKPTDADSPPPSRFPVRRVRLIDGQMSLEESQGGEDAA